MDKDPLSLRKLPTQNAPDGLWRAIEQGLDTPARRRPRLAVAAALVAAIALLAVLETAPPPPERTPVADGASLLASARQASLQLEQAVLDGRSNVLGAGDAAELAWIESELRLTDELLSERPRDVNLWLKRTELLGEMARRYDSNDWQTQIRLASY